MLTNIIPRIAISLICLVTAASAVAACGGGGDEATPSPTPTASATPTPAPTPTARTFGPTQPPPQTSYRLVFREFAPHEDVIWRINPLDAAGKEEIARIPHREGYGLKPSLSPDGRLLAYLLLPEFAISVQSSQAEAFVLDLETKETVKLATGIDMTFAPLWSPDSRLLYLRRLAGPEFLAAEVSILRIRVPRADDPTPSPTPRPAPDQTPDPSTPTPTPDPLQLVIKDTVAHVLSFAPIGFAEDGRSMYFVQVQGGTGGGTLVAIYSPATLEALAAVQKIVDDERAAVERENQRRAEEAIANQQPTPDVTLTPRPTPTPDARFIVQISQQVAFDYELSPDLRKVSYLDQQFLGDEILNRAFVANLVEATTAPLPETGLVNGHHLRPVWHPDSNRLTIGILPSGGGPGIVALVAPDGSGVTFLPQPQTGFDTPRSWAPDGSWLAVTHNVGTSVANPGAARLDLVAPTGQRVTIIEGADNANEDSILGWVNIPPPTPVP